MNRLKKAFACLLLLPLMGCTEPDVAQLLEAFQWRKQVLVVLVQGDGQVQQQKMRAYISQGQALLEAEEVVVLEVVRNAYVAVDDARKAHLPTAPFLEYFHAKEAPFMLIWIGKDGFEKHRGHVAMPLAELIGHVRNN